LVPEALAEATEYFGTSEFDVWVDERGRAARLTSALGLAGFAPIQDTVVLGLLGPVRSKPGPEALRVENVVDDDGLRAWAAVKLRGFGDSEDQPTAAQTQQEMSVRQAEWPVCCYQLAYLGAEPVAMLGHNTGPDQ